MNKGFIIQIARLKVNKTIYCFIIGLVVLFQFFGCQQKDPCPNTRIQNYYLSEKMKKLDIYKMGDTLTFINNLNDSLEIIVRSINKNMWVKSYNDNVCLYNDCYEYYAYNLLSDNSQLKIGYTINKMVQGGCSYPIHDFFYDVLSFDINGTKFQIENDPIFLDNRDSVIFSNGGGFFKTQKFGGKTYQNVYKSTAQICYEPIKPERAIYFNAEIGILKIQLSSNESYEFLNKR